MDTIKTVLRNLGTAVVSHAQAVWLKTWPSAVVVGALVVGVVLGLVL